MSTFATSLRRGLVLILPGLLVAATGVGAGDLATAAFAGRRLGLTVLWAVIVGAAVKLLLTEGLARWQLVTGTTFIEGASRHFGRLVRWPFFVYLLLWAFCVGAALMSACGVTAAALLPTTIVESLGGMSATKVILGATHSLVALILVWFGGYWLFERVAAALIATMFLTVVACAVALQPPVAPLVSGALWPSFDLSQPQALLWTVALMGGVGGTLTILCYGYWIREAGRRDVSSLFDSRIDLAVGYAATAVFGMAMVVIGSTVSADEKGARLMVQLADRLHSVLGPLGRWTFLIGAWSAVTSSLLGVWQSVPYLFADVWHLADKRAAVERSSAAQADTTAEGRKPKLADTWAYRLFLLGLSTLPAVGMWVEFERIQMVYAVVGALFMPLLAWCLLLMIGRSRWVGKEYQYGVVSWIALVGAILFFLVLGYVQIADSLG